MCGTTEWKGKSVTEIDIKKVKRQIDKRRQLERA